jgi:hypothetical protein
VTVFVDDMYLYPMGQFGRMKMSHMIADTDEELHAMAAQIGVARRWHQAPPRHDSHYDIAMVMRTLAIAAGAVPITLRQLSTMNMHRRRTGVLPSLDDVPRLQEETVARVRATMAEHGYTPESPSDRS